MRHQMDPYQRNIERLKTFSISHPPSWIYLVDIATGLKHSQTGPGGYWVGDDINTVFVHSTFIGISYRRDRTGNLIVSPNPVWCFSYRVNVTLQTKNPLQVIGNQHPRFYSTIRGMELTTNECYDLDHGHEVVQETATGDYECTFTLPTREFVTAILGSPY